MVNFNLESKQVKICPIKWMQNLNAVTETQQWESQWKNIQLTLNIILREN